METFSVTEKKTPPSISIEEGKHLVGEFIGDETGPSLIVFGTIHGNEPSGLMALRRIAPKLERLREKLKGRVFLLAGNTRAINRRVRFIDSDLNRHWTAENASRNRPVSTGSPQGSEDLEQREILAKLEQILNTARDEVYAMDLHSTSAESEPFAMFGDTFRNRRFARKFPAIFLLGIEEQLDGTIMEYLNNLGAITLGFEAGQHTGKTAVDNQEALVWLALINSGILAREEIDAEKYEGVLRAAMGRPRIIEIRYRHAIDEDDDFKMKPGYRNFQKVRRGEVLAGDRRGEIRAEETALILMPLYQAQGDDGFFLGREISGFWLSLSGLLRRLGAQKIMPFLPGVRRDPADPDSLVVDTRVARILPLQIFHLLGFRKRRWRDQKLIVSRRRFDTRSPFKKK
ncbi:MAG: succinylglutamate desuccinylase/aspartoacylase family protein [Pyrinomonadaceae bacterium]